MILQLKEVKLPFPSDEMSAKMNQGFKKTIGQKPAQNDGKSEKNKDQENQKDQKELGKPTKKNMHFFTFTGWKIRASTINH